MGASESILRPQELVEFRKFTTSIDNIEVPAPASSRKFTDKKGFILFGLGLIILLPFLIYTLANSGIDHLEEPPMRTETYNFKSTGSGDFNINFVLDFEWWNIIPSLIITIGICVGVIVLLRYIPGVVIWISIALYVVLLLLMTFGSWVGYMGTGSSSTLNQTGRVNPYESMALFAAVIWTIIALVLLIILGVLFKKIGLVIQLYKEAAKVLADIPLIIFVPISCTVIYCIILIASIYTTIVMYTDRGLNSLTSTGYERSGTTTFTITANAFIGFWTLRFIEGYRFMVISGSVSHWYFAENKNDMGFPILKSLKNTSVFHVGTILFGSLLITLFTFIKMFLKALFRNCRCCVIMCCSYVEILLKFLSEQSYIVTALHGQSYLRSANRATKLLLTNAKSMIAINCVGEFVLFMIMLTITIVSTVIAAAIFMNQSTPPVFPIVICFFANIIIVSITFGTFQVIIDSLFICFCEDMVINDGLSRPYKMSRGLMEFVENSKKLYSVSNTSWK